MPLLIKFVPAPKRRGLPLFTLKWSISDSLGARSSSFQVGFNVRCYPGYKTSNQNSLTTAPGACIACAAGQYNLAKSAGTSAYDQTVCLTCLAGTYQNATGSTECIVAQKNYYVPLDGASEQLHCPDRLHMVSRAGASAIDDCVCQVGTFINGTDIFTRTCSTCDPALTICDRENQIFPLPRVEGVWIDPQNGEIAQTCPLARACPKWDSYTAVLTGQCATGYTGVQCAACRVGFYRSNGTCKRCNNHAWVIYVIAALVLAIVIPILFKLAQYDVFASINILIAYLQVRDTVTARR